jgi:hypothetical protein
MHLLMLEHLTWILQKTPSVSYGQAAEKWVEIIFFETILSFYYRKSQLKLKFSNLHIGRTSSVTCCQLGLT